MAGGVGGTGIQN